MRAPQVALQRGQLLAVLEADQVVGEDGFPGLDRWLGGRTGFWRPVHGFRLVSSMARLQIGL